MQHRIQIDISFDTEQEAKKLLNYIEGIKDKAYKPKGTEKILCHRTARYHACTHDNAEPTPCNGYIDVDFDKDKKTH